MKTLIKIIAALFMGILFSACRVEIPPEQPEEPEPEEDTEEEEATPDEEMEDIETELEIIDSLEIDPFWNEALQEDAGAVLDRVLDVCVVLDIENMSDVVLDLINEDIPLLSVAHLLETAIFIVCPEFENDYQKWFNKNI